MIRFSTPLRYLTIIFVSAFFFIIQQALSYSTGPPTGLTGAPGEGECTSCHSGTAITNSNKISVYSNMANGQYIPDSTYTIILRARSSSCVRFGFETTMLSNSSSPSKLGTLIVPTGATNIQLSTGTRDYMMHTQSGTSAIYTDSTDWAIRWTAPSTLSDTARMYIAVNVTDNSSSSSGDEINLNSFFFPQTTNVPVPTITTNVNAICLNDSIFFQGSGTNGTSTYQWTFPGGTPASSNAQNLWVKFSGSGTKVCSLRVANSIMNSAYTTKSVTVNALPTASLSYNSSQVLCEGDSIALTATSNASYTYQWQKDGSNISGASSNIFMARLNGNYRVIVTNTTGGCAINTSPVSISFNVKPQANLTAPAGITSCQGDSVRLKANGGTNYSYTWYKDNILQAQTTDSNFYVRQNGAYNVKITTVSGCNTLSNTLNVFFFIKPSGSISAAVDTVCQGDSILLSALSSDTIASYQWKRNAINISGVINKNYYGLSSGSYTVELITNRGCKTTLGPKIITMNALPATNFIDSTKNTCTYSLKIRNSGTFTFQWQRNGITFNTTDSIVTASLSGTYSLIITNASGCKITTNAIVLNIPNAPNANITPLSNAVICSDSPGVSYQVPFAASTTYKWFKNGNLINGATQNSLNIPDSGNYYVLVDNGVCAVNSSTRNVKVNMVPSANFMDSIKTGCAYILKLRNGGNFNLEWRRNGTVFNTIDTLITVSQGGTYSLKITNASGCSINTNNIVLNFPLSLPNATITPAANAVICSDSSISYQVPSATGTVFKWYKNGSLITGANQNSLSIADSGNYFVTVDNGFCIATSAVRNVKVNVLPSATISTADSSFCTGDSALLNGALVTGASYLWYKNNNPLSNAGKQNYYAGTAGSYRLKVSLGSCFKMSNTINVTEKLLPAIPVITRSVNLLSSSAATAYQWYKNGVIIPGAIQQAYTISADGIYSVQITSANGCKNISAGMSATFTGINSWAAMAGVTAYPNPVHAVLSLNFSDDAMHEITVADAAGRVLKILSEKGSKATIDFSVLEAGIYFIKVSSNGYSQIIRIVKK